jgi:Flp pilus assembly protein TadG
MKREERGAALVEFALALPLLLVVLAGIVDFGFAFQRYEVITNAAREGARLATLPGYQDATLVENRVRQYVQQGLAVNTTTLDIAMPVGNVTTQFVPVSVSTGTGNVDVDTAIVTVNYSHNFLLLGPVMSLINANWGGSITLTATSQMRIES